MGKEGKILRLDERLVYGGSYCLTPRAFKTIFYIVSKHVDPRAEKLPGMVRVSVRELSAAIMDGKPGSAYNSLYREIDSLCRELCESTIAFKSGVEVQGAELNSYVSWCAGAVVTMHGGVKCVEFYFGEYMSQFFQGLSKYVRLYRPELNRLGTGYAIRLFQILKGDRNKKEKFAPTSVRNFELGEFRFLLGLGDKYQKFKELKRRILQNAVDQINEKTTVMITDVKYYRKGDGRRVTHVEFHFMNQEPVGELGYFPKLESLKDFVPTPEDLDKHSRSQGLAYGLLTGFGVKPGIAYRKILPGIGGSESYGFEDYFIKASLEYFYKHARNLGHPGQAAATFVNWWTKHRVYDLSGDVWTKINEKVVQAKKGLERSHPENFANRVIARTMTDKEFATWYEKECTGPVALTVLKK